MKNALVAVALLLSSTAFARTFEFHRARPGVVLVAPRPVAPWAARPFLGRRGCEARRFQRRFYRW
jgi:hypothetical protein